MKERKNMEVIAVDDHFESQYKHQTINQILKNSLQNNREIQDYYFADSRDDRFIKFQNCLLSCFWASFHRSLGMGWFWCSEFWSGSFEFLPTEVPLSVLPALCDYAHSFSPNEKYRIEKTSLMLSSNAMSIWSDSAFRIDIFPIIHSTN